METLLYAQLAEHLIDHIKEGAYQIGDKLPSVRALAKKQQVSIATVNSAYAILEEQGWAEARPKSGYFVRRTHLPGFNPPSVSKVKAQPRAVTNMDLALQVQREASASPEHNFSCAIPDLSMSIISAIQKTFIRLTRSGVSMSAGYDATEGLFELRQQVARRAIDAGIHISPDALITTVGAQNAIALALRAVTKQGDIIAVESPCYFGLLQMIEGFGLKAIEIPSDPEQGMSVDALKLALQQWPIKTVLCVSSFSNPLGATIPDENKQAIIKLLEQHDISLIEDDIYGELQFEGHRPRAFKAFDPDGRVLWCSSVSKTMNPQLRVGWIAPGRYYDEVLRQKYTQYLASPAIAQAVTAEIMSKGLYDRHLRLARENYRRRYEQLSYLTQQYFPQETLATSPKGGLVTWYEMPKKVNATEIYHQCRDVNVRIAPGELFSISGLYRNHFRLTFANDWTPGRIDGLKLLGERLKQMVVS